MKFLLQGNKWLLQIWESYFGLHHYIFTKYKHQCRRNATNTVNRITNEHKCFGHYRDNGKSCQSNFW